LGGRLAAERRNRTIRHLRLVLAIVVGLVMMMTSGPHASARQPTRAGALGDRDIFAMAVSWSPVPPAGVTGSEPPGGTFLDNILDARVPFPAPQPIPGAEGRKNTQLIQLRMTY
jgi:hypothetical protein